MAHFYDDDATPVYDALEALALMRPDVAFDRAQKVIYHTAHDPRTSVALVSGGGAGHEPAHAGYVGRGALTAAVSGFIFASPSVAQIVAAVARVGGPAGVLLIIKNCTGDVFHFHLAAEKAKAAAARGVPVEVLVVGDDVAVGRAQSGKVGRRGLAGTVLVHKILGAFAGGSSSPDGAGAAPPTLAQVRALGQAVAANLATVGASLGHVHIPGRAAEPVAAAPNNNQVELGMGIHNEPGCRVLAPRPSLAALVDTMLDQLLDDADADRAYVSFSSASENVVLLVNNLGGVSPLEFGGITTTVVRALAARGIHPVRLLAGAYMTSLDGPGFSVTLLRATPQMVDLLDAPTTAVHWIPATRIYDDVDQGAQATVAVEDETADGPSSGVLLDAAVFGKVVAAACASVVAREAAITQHDTVVGDGDCGVTLARGAKAVQEFVKKLLSASGTATADAVRTFRAVTAVVENSMDGTSGALYSIFFAALTAELAYLDAPRVLGARDWVAAVAGALARLQQATPARQGDRTLMDALEPCVRALAGSADPEQPDLAAAVAAARSGVEATRGMKASLGRAVYVEASNWEAVPDPGAEGVLAILEGIAGALE